MAKLTTAEKIALARQQDSGGGGGSAAPAPAAEATAPTPAAESGKKLSPIEMARQQGAQGGGAAKPAAAGAGGKKLSPLEMARQQGSGGGAASGKKLSPLEMARQQGAQGGGGTAPAAAAATQASGAAASAKAPPVSVEGKSVQEMIEAARKPAGEESDKPKLPKLPKKALPATRKPAAMAKKPATDSARRGILAGIIITPFLIAWALLGTATGIFSLYLARFLMPNVLVEPPTRFKIGVPGDFPPEAVITKFKAERGIWLVNTSSYNGVQMIYALSSVCTHLGCTPNWLEGEQKYKCPCHGSGFYKSGINFEGPAPRPLERVGLALAPDGQLEVDKSLKFQEEMGQWEDGASFVPV